MKPRTSALLLTSLLGLSQCIMPEAVAPVETLPDATQTGANTAGCRVDDLIWLPGYDYIDFMGARPISARWSKSPATGGHGLSLLLSKSIKGPQVHDRTHVSLFVPDITRPGTFVLDQAANPQFGSTNPAYGGFTFSRAFPNQQLLTGPGAPGRLVVTRLDTISRVVSGTFEFSARQATTGTSVRVTEGRFDCSF
ncbi:hypothetical protein [Hymenobacter antarcticus]|uniref:Lipoprotein n=1 Tax=Hymenobacter antarcticus TaxID=486270 RepID=A0ABP7Q4C3_9BACT